MGFWGKVIGAAIGGSRKGLWGAAVGALLGHLVDKGIENYSNKKKSTLHAQDCLVGLCAKVAKADGVVTADEIKVVNLFFVQSLELAGEALEDARKTFLRFKDDPSVTHQSLATELLKTVRKKDMLRYVLHALLALAHAGGSLKPVEDQMLRDIAQIFRISSEEYTYLKRSYYGNRTYGNSDAGGSRQQSTYSQPDESDDLVKLYAMLESSPTDSFDVVKRNYRKLVSKYHPDKLSKDLPADLIAFSTNRFREIQEAYEKVKTLHSKV